MKLGIDKLESMCYCIVVGERNSQKKGRIEDMKEELNVAAVKEGDTVKIRVQGLCTDNLVYAVISSLLEGMREGVRKNED